MTRRIVTIEDIQGSAIHKYADDVPWWSRASGQPSRSVNVVCTPKSSFERVEIDFPDDSSAENFEAYVESFGVRVQRGGR